MGIGFPYFFLKPDLIVPFLRSLFLAKLIDYAVGLIGSFAVASIAQMSLDLDLGAIISFLIELYRRAVTVLLDPLSTAIVALLRNLFPRLSIDLAMSGEWKDGIVLLGIYYQKHARNEWVQGHRLTAVYQFVAGILIALSFGVALNFFQFADPGVEGIVLILSFGFGVLCYDFAFLTWSTLFLRKSFAKKHGRPVEEPLVYFSSRFQLAVGRVAPITFVVAVGYWLLHQVAGWATAGQAFNIIMLLIGLAWVSRGLRISSENVTEPAAAIERYKSLPAGMLGNAVVFPILLGYVLVILGLAETATGSTIELLLGSAPLAHSPAFGLGI